MTLTTVMQATIMGPQPLPITEVALAQIDRDNAPADVEVGKTLWSRLLAAGRSRARAKTDRSHDAIYAAGQIKALTLVLADTFGMAPTFWEMELRLTLQLEAKT